MSAPSIHAGPRAARDTLSGFANQPVPDAMPGLEDEVVRRDAQLWMAMAVN